MILITSSFLRFVEAYQFNNSFIAVFQPLKEYILYVDAIKEALNRRDQLETELIARKDTLEKKKQELADAQKDEAGGLRAWVKTFENQENKIQRLTQSVSSSQTSVEVNFSYLLFFQFIVFLGIARQARMCQSKYPGRW